MYARLLSGNLKKNFRDYGIFFFTVALAAAVFYAFNTIGLQASFLSESISDVFQLMATLLKGLTVGLAVILGFLMVYANNYLLKRRKKEFGLYEMLGMKKTSASLIMMGETFICFVIALAVGIAVGVVLSQFLIFVSAALFQNAVSNFHFIFSWDALRLVVLCFGITFLITLLLNLISLHHLNLEKLLKGGRMNEEQHLRKGWVALCVGLAGIALLVFACVRLTFQGFPLDAVNSGDSQSLVDFLITTLLMIIGVYALFFAGPSLFVLVAIRAERFYYKGLRMFTIRQVASRITTNSFSMGTVCLVLFLAITSVSTGLGIAIGTSTDLDRTVPYTATISGTFVSEDGSSHLAPPAEGGSIPQVADVLKERGLDVTSYKTQATQVDLYLDPDVDATYKQALDTLALQDDNEEYHAPTLAPDAPVLETFLRYGSAEEKRQLSGSAASIGITPLRLEPLSCYNKTCSLLGAQTLSLPTDRYAVTVNTGGEALNQVLEKALSEGCPIKVAGQVLAPSKITVISDKTAALADMGYGGNTTTLIVPDAVVDRCIPHSFSLQMLSPQDQAKAFQEYCKATEESYNQVHPSDDNLGAFRTFGTVPLQISLISLQDTIIKDAQSVTGLVGYLAAYIGFILVMSVATIIAIQMLTNVSDSAGRYRLLWDLGTPYHLLKRTLVAQILFYFLLPLVVGFGVAAVAMAQVEKVANLLMPFSIVQSSLVAALVFLSVYGVYLFICYAISKGLLIRATT